MLSSTDVTRPVSAVVVPVFVFPANRVSASVFVYVVALSAFEVYSPLIAFWFANPSAYDHLPPIKRSVWVLVYVWSMIAVT